MTLSVKTTLSAVAAAIAAAAVLATASVPVQAEFQRAPYVKRKIMKMKKLYALSCLASSGDIVAQPLVINTTGKILPIGRKIQWKATLANRTIRNGTYTLTTPLYAGQSRSIPVILNWKFTCKASVFA